MLRAKGSLADGILFLCVCSMDGDLESCRAEKQTDYSQQFPNLGPVAFFKRKGFEMKRYMEDRHIIHLGRYYVL